jgi:hypothetical protein
MNREFIANVICMVCAALFLLALGVFLGVVIARLM